MSVTRFELEEFIAEYTYDEFSGYSKPSCLTAYMSSDRPRLVTYESIDIRDGTVHSKFIVKDMGIAWLHENGVTDNDIIRLCDKVEYR